MKLLMKLATHSSSWHEFLADVMRWLKWYTSHYPELKRWTKKDLRNFYDQIKEVQSNGFSKTTA